MCTGTMRNLNNTVLYSATNDLLKHSIDILLSVNVYKTYNWQGAFITKTCKCRGIVRNVIDNVLW